MYCLNNKFVFLLLAVLLLFSFGCVDTNEEEVVPELIENSYKLEDFAIAGVRAELYSTHDPVEDFSFGTSPIYLYFPDKVPNQINTATVELELRLISPLGDYTNEDSFNILEHVPEGLLLSAPTSSPMTFDESGYFFYGNISLYHYGTWRLDITWKSDIEVQSVSLQFDIGFQALPKNIIPVCNDESSSSQFNYLVEWVTPIEPVSGFQNCTLKIWEVIGFGQIFVPSVNDTVKVITTQNTAPSLSITSETTLLVSGEEEGLYEGEIEFFAPHIQAKVTVVIKNEVVFSRGIFYFYPKIPPSLKNEDQ
jgi:hypothetical protein